METPVVEVQMLIRKPAETVFHAFTDPSITKNFWFSRSSGSLEAGKTITWEWEMYGVAAVVLVNELKPYEKISIQWGEPPTTVDFHFESIDATKTYVTIRNYGFASHGNALLRDVMDNTGGFTTVLDGLKAYLEFGISLNLVGDKFLKK